MTTATFAAVNERELRRHGYDMEALAKFAWRLNGVGKPDAVARTVIEGIAEEFGMPRIALVASPDGGRLTVLASLGLEAAHTAPPSQDQIMELAQRDRHSLLVARADPKHDPWLSAAFAGSRNLGLVPMHAEGHPMGVVCFEYGARRGSRIEHRIVTMVERFVSHASLAVTNAFLLERLSALAETDGLTSAANRRTFEQRLDAEIDLVRRERGQLSIVLFHVDGFGTINDTHGHTTGNEILCTVVEVARRICRADDLIARYGGAEFAILLPATDTDEAFILAERIRTSVSGGATAVPVTVSLGLANLPRHANIARGLVECAAAALNRSKRSGGDRSTRFDAPLVSGGPPSSQQ